MAVRLRVGVAALVLVTVASGCGGANDESGGNAVTESASGVTVTGELSSKPELTIPDGQPPAELEITDLVVGDGAQVEEGATVTTHYVGKSWTTGEQFDASWDRGQPISFPLSNVIAGWTQGIPGMKVGGRRLLVIPPDLGYGDSPPTDTIKPGDTLVFVIDMVETQ